MRERVGSRRASYLDYSENLNIFTPSNALPPLTQAMPEQTIAKKSDENDSSVLGFISEDEEPTAPSSAV
jgi:hypothetical protein